jgi:threonine dehydrogenase-like Zn-dependent dehydrogenase
MKAITLIPGTTNVSVQEVPEPTIHAGNEVKVKILQVGICGTDREEAAGGRASAPDGKKELIIGHEMFGQVVETGKNVRSVKPGDYAMFTVRRGCGECAACLNDRSDMCFTGNYTERGIKGADGFQSQYVVDKEEFIVKIPEAIKEIGVLTEPMSVAAKAIDEAVNIQTARLPLFDETQNWLTGKKALIAGIGAIGLMAAFALRLQGAEVMGMDIVDEHTLRPSLIKKIGGTYIDSRKMPVENLDDIYGQFDLVFEAAGVAKLQLELIDALGINGIYVATGIPHGHRPLNLPVASLMQQLVLNNQVVVGSVNAGIKHYKMAVDFLEACHQRWPALISQTITERVPYSDFKTALKSQSVDEIKVVVDWE